MPFFAALSAAFGLFCGAAGCWRGAGAAPIAVWVALVAALVPPPCAARLMGVRRFDFGAALGPIASSIGCFGLRFLLSSPRNDGYPSLEGIYYVYNAMGRWREGGRFAVDGC